MINIDKAITDSGIKKKKVADELGVRPETLSRKIKNPETFTAEQMAKLSYILKIKVTDLDFNVFFYNWPWI